MTDQLDIDQLVSEQVEWRATTPETTLLVTEVRRLRRYKSKTEAWKRQLFALLGCGSNSRIIEEITKLQQRVDH